MTVSDRPAAALSVTSRTGTAVPASRSRCAAAAAAHRDLLASTSVPIRLVTEKAAAGLSETVSPQGLVAVCDLPDVPAARLPAAPPRLAVALAGINDPGNAGTVLRTADACGAGAVVFGAGSVDPFGGKVVRAGAGSHFHLDVVRSAPLAELLPALQAAGAAVLVADGRGEVELPDVADRLAGPAVWLFGNEARGVPSDLAELADARVRIPMRRGVSSLNLATSVAATLYGLTARV